MRDALREALVRHHAAAQGSRRSERLQRFLSDEAWPQVPLEVQGHPMTRTERESLLGIGPEGV